MPCTLTDDTKFSRLRDVSNQYFEEWLVSAKQRDGNFSRKEKKAILHLQLQSIQLLVVVIPSESSQIHFD